MISSLAGVVFEETEARTQAALLHSEAYDHGSQRSAAHSSAQDRRLPLSPGMKLRTQPGAKSGEPLVKGPPKPRHEKAEKDGGDDYGYGHVLRAQGGGEEVEFQLLGTMGPIDRGFGL